MKKIFLFIVKLFFPLLTIFFDVQITFSQTNDLANLKKPYLEILEKTNQQLSLWWNPYGILIGALGILFAVLAIFTIIIIFTKSKEYKDRLEEDRKNYAKKIEEFLEKQKSIIHERNEQAKIIESNLDKLIKQYELKLENTTGEAKKEIQNAIESLQREKITLQANVGPMTVIPDYISSIPSITGFAPTFHKCSNCNFGFRVSDTISTLTINLGNKTVICPKCGNIDLM